MPHKKHGFPETFGSLLISRESKTWMYVLFSQRSLSEHCDLSGFVSLLWVTRESHCHCLNIVLGKQIPQRDLKISKLQLSYGNVPIINSDKCADNYHFYTVLSLVFMAPRMCLPQFCNLMSGKCMLLISVSSQQRFGVTDIKPHVRHKLSLLLVLQMATLSP